MSPSSHHAIPSPTPSLPLPRTIFLSTSTSNSTPPLPQPQTPPLRKAPPALYSTPKNSKTRTPKPPSQNPSPKKLQNRPPKSLTYTRNSTITKSPLRLSLTQSTLNLPQYSNARQFLSSPKYTRPPPPLPTLRPPIPPETPTLHLYNAPYSTTKMHIGKYRQRGPMTTNKTHYPTTTLPSKKLKTNSILYSLTKNRTKSYLK